MLKPKNTKKNKTVLTHTTAGQAGGGVGGSVISGKTAFEKQ